MKRNTTASYIDKSIDKLNHMVALNVLHFSNNKYTKANTTGNRFGAFSIVLAMQKAMDGITHATFYNYLQAFRANILPMVI